MGTQQYKELLNVIKEQMSKGIYAVEKKGYAEIKKESVASTTKLCVRLKHIRC